MYETYDNDIFKLLNHYADQIQPISFIAGMGGGLIYRILAHNDAYYWEDGFAGIVSDQKCKRALDWPDHDLGYNTARTFKDKDGNYVAKNPLLQQLTSVHVGDWFFPSNEANKRWSKEKTIRKYFGYLKKLQNKKLLARTHDMHVHTRFPKMTVIRVYGPPYRKIGMYAEYSKSATVQPIERDNVINVNINNILSTNYVTFEKEYFNLCKNLKINPTPIPVRGYILNYLDRLSNYSNNVTPRVKS